MDNDKLFLDSADFKKYLLEIENISKMKCVLTAENIAVSFNLLPKSDFEIHCVALSGGNYIPSPALYP